MNQGRFPTSEQILKIVPYESGPQLDASLIQMASNENCFGPSPLAINAMQEALQKANRYPDSSGLTLRNAIAEKLRVDADSIILGNGSTELVEMLTKVYLTREDNCVTADDTFLMYRVAVLAARSKCKEIALRNFTYDLDAILTAVDSETRMILIANPNNPTGTMVPQQELEPFLQQVPAQVLVVLDEAYSEYVVRENYPNGLQYLKKYPNLVVLRTFSKIYGLAGLRIGYAIADPEIIAILDRVRSPFNTSHVAQLGALAALGDEDHVRVSRERNCEGQTFLEQELGEAKIPYVRSVANFVFLPMKNSQDVQTRLLEHGVFVRAVRNGLRVTISTREENLEFLTALNEVL